MNNSILNMSNISVNNVTANITSNSTNNTSTCIQGQTQAPSDDTEKFKTDFQGQLQYYKRKHQYVLNEIKLWTEKFKKREGHSPTRQDKQPISDKFNEYRFCKEKIKQLQSKIENVQVTQSQTLNQDEKANQSKSVSPGHMSQQNINLNMSNINGSFDAMNVSTSQETPSILLTRSVMNSSNYTASSQSKTHKDQINYWMEVNQQKNLQRKVQTQEDIIKGLRLELKNVLNDNNELKQQVKRAQESQLTQETIDTKIEELKDENQKRLDELQKQRETDLEAMRRQMK